MAGHRHSSGGRRHRSRSRTPKGVRFGCSGGKSPSRGRSPHRPITSVKTGGSAQWRSMPSCDVRVKSKSNHPHKRLPARGAGVSRRNVTPGGAILGNYVAAVLNPWTNSPVRGISAGGLTNSATTRRSRIFVVNVNNDSSDTTEMAISLMDPRDPFLMLWTGTNVGDDYTWSANQYGYDKLVGGLPTPLSTTIPLGSVARVVSAGVIITYMGIHSYRGGSWYQFAHNKVTANGEVGSSTDSSLYPGYLRSGLEQRISSAAVGNSPIRFIKAPSSVATHLVVDPFNHEGTHPGPADVIQPSSDCIRLMFTGPAHPLTFQIEVVQHVEFYHDSRRNDSVAAFNHTAGQVTTDMLISHLTVPGTATAIPHAGSIWNNIEDATGTILRSAANVGQTVWGAKQLWDRVSGVAAPVSEALALL